MPQAAVAVAPVSSATPNVPTLAGLMETAKALGTDAGNSKDTQVRFLLAVVEGAYIGVIDNTKDKHGKDVDDAIKLAECYVRAQTAATMFDPKAPNQEKLISCLRTGVRLGGYSKGGQGEPLATVNTLIDLWRKLRAKKSVNMDDAFNTVMRFARKQLKEPTLIPEDQLQDFCFKRLRGNMPTKLECVTALRDSTLKLYNGKAAKNTVKDNSPLIKQCLDALNKRVLELAAEEAKAKRGLSVVKYDTASAQAPLPPEV